MKRRELLQSGLGIAAIAAGWLPPAEAQEDTPDALPGHVVRRGDADYDAARQGYNARIAGYPAAITFCQNANEVAGALLWARANHVPLRARCGRHSYEGYSLIDNGLVIDVSAMDGIWLDKAQQIVHVGAGLRLLELYTALWPDRVMVPGGSCATVGIAGLTLGGGYGLSARRFGLTCDNLVAIEIVTADGRIRRASADTAHYTDLLWACRGGGGGNFGIVTSLAFKVHPVENVAIYNVTWDAADLEAVLNAWQAWAPHIDDRLTSVLKLRARQKGTISSTGQFAGTADELTRLLKPLMSTGTPQGVSVVTVPYIEAVGIFAGLQPDYRRWQMHAPTAGDIQFDGHTQFKGASDFADRPLTPAATATLRRFLESAPADGDLVQLENYGGAIGRIPTHATAYPHRAGTLFGLQYQAYWNPSMPAEHSLSWVRDFRQAMQPHVSGRAYVNYIDADLPNAPHAYYGANLPRLARIKAKYDPHNVFQFPQSIVASRK